MTVAPLSVAPLSTAVNEGLARFASESAGEAATWPILPSLIAVPLITAFVLLFVPATRPEYSKIVALLGSSLTGALSLFVLADFDKGDAGLQFVSRHVWISDLGL